MNKNIRFGLITAIFVLTMLIMFWPQINGKAYFWEDFSEQVYPVQNYAAVETNKGNFPHWNPYTFGGMPFYADPQVGYFYPMNRLMGLFVNDGQLSSKVVELFIILHFLIAQLAMFFFLRYIKRSEIASIIGAIGYSFSMIFIAHVFHPMMIYQFAWFPLAFMLFKKALDKQCFMCGLWSGLVWAMIFHAGHPQTTIYLLMIVVAYFLWDLIAKLRKHEFEVGQSVGKFVLIAVMVGVIASGLYMVQLLPTRELQDNAVRSEMSYDNTAEGSMEIKQILQMAVPKIFGHVMGDNPRDRADENFHLKIDDNFAPYYYYWDTAFFFGVAILFLGLIALRSQIKKRMPAFMLFIGLFGLAYALGNNFILHPILNKLPVLDYFRMPARILIMLVFAFSTLAAFGFDSLTDDTIDLKKKRASLLMGGTVPFIFVMGTIIGAFPADTPQQYVAFVKGQGGLQLFFFAVVFVAAWLLPKLKDTKKIIVVGLIIAVSLFTELYLTGHELNTKTEMQDTFTGRLIPFVPENEHKVQPQLLKVIKQKEPNEIFRTTTRLPKPYNMPVIKRNAGMINRVMMTDGYNQLNLAHRVPPTKERMHANDLLNAKYIFVVEEGGIRYIENQKAFGHFRLYNDFKVMNPEEQKINMQSATDDLSVTVLLDAQPSLDIAKTSAPSGAVKCTKYESNEITCEVKTPNNTILVFSEIWYPAWKAYIDGKETDIFRANYSLRAVEIPSGIHTVEMKYESSAFKAGGTISLITLILTILGIVWTTIRNKKSINSNSKEN